MLRLLISANLCLDLPLTGYSQSAREQRRRESLRRPLILAEEAVRQRADGVIIAGNLFSFPGPSPAAWEAVRAGARILAEAGIPLLLLEGTRDAGPFYREPYLEAVRVLAGGEAMEFLPGLVVAIDRELPGEGGILAWRGDNPPDVPVRSLVLLPEADSKSFREGCLAPGAPLRLDFDRPEEPSYAIVAWDQESVDVEEVPLPDRIYATVHWDVDERGVELAPYLEERQDPELALRVILSGYSTEPLPVEEWERRYGPGYFLLVIQDETRPAPGIFASSPLANEAFAKRVLELTAAADLPLERARLYHRAWILGQKALRRGEKRAD